MNYRHGEVEIIHRTPIWKERSNFIFASLIGTSEGRHEWEQLWGQRTAAHRFVLCCIPFFGDDLALGDEVETASDFVVKNVVQHSGHMTFRAWLGNQNSEVREKLAREIEGMGLLLEWSSESLVALSARDKLEATALTQFLQAREERGQLQYDLGSTHPAA